MSTSWSKGLDFHALSSWLSEFSYKLYPTLEDAIVSIAPIGYHEWLIKAADKSWTIPGAYLDIILDIPNIFNWNNGVENPCGKEVKCMVDLLNVLEKSTTIELLTHPDEEVRYLGRERSK